MIFCALLDSFWLRKAMRGEDHRSKGFFSYVRLETRIPADHPLRAIRELVDAALQELSRSFDRVLCPRRTAVGPAGAAVGRAQLAARCWRPHRASH